VYSEVASLGGLLAKDEYIKVVFIQDSLLASFIFWVKPVFENPFKYQTKHFPVRVFLVKHVRATLDSNLDAADCDIPTTRFIEQDSYPNGIQVVISRKR
jgi:hypothetical protein